MAQAPPPAGTPATSENQLAQWAMYAGIGGIVLFLLGLFIPVVGFIGLLAGIAALIMGIMGNNKAKMMGGLGKSQAMTGLILGAVTIGLFVIFLIIAGAFIASL
jgi:multisubunit Na+/H+ antiporter MnhB subunit